MNIIKPDYYDEFKCIAGECEYTCCQCWNIHMDDETIGKWNKLESPVSESGKLSKHITRGFGQDVIKFNKDKRCPLLNDKGLCEVVLKYGEETLSKACHEFPREAREHVDRCEQNLSVGCRTVIDLLWSREVFSIGRQDSIDSVYNLRQFFMELIQDKDFDMTLLLECIFYYASEADSKCYSEAIIGDIIVDGKSMIPKIDELLGARDDNDIEAINECNEILLDILVNYKNKNIYMEYIGAIYSRAEELSNEDMDSFADFKKELQRYERELRLLIAEEIYDSYIAESGSEDNIFKLEWIYLSYIALRQYLFISWLDKKELKLEDLRVAISVIYRIMGYCEEDILDYLGESFENVWDMGYVKFILN